MKGVQAMIVQALVALLLIGSQPRTAGAQQRDSTHTVQAGETLFSISGRYGLTVTELQRINGIVGTTIRVGQVLRIVREQAAPQAPGQTDMAEPVDEAGPPDEADPAGGALPPVEVDLSPDPGPESRRFSVDGSVSIIDVALRLGVSPDTLLGLNPDLPEIFSAGDSLVVPAGLAFVEVRVRQGDTLFGLATRHGSTVAAIRARNDLNSDRIRVGQVLRIPTGNALPDLSGMPPGDAEGLVTEYPERFAGRLMASGRPYDPSAFTVAHPSLDLGTVLLVTEPKTGRSVFAEVADRMPVREGIVAEVSQAVAVALGRPETAVIVRIIDRPRAEDGP